MYGEHIKVGDIVTYRNRPALVERIEKVKPFFEADYEYLVFHMSMEPPQIWDGMLGKYVFGSGYVPVKALASDCKF